MRPNPDTLRAAVVSRAVSILPSAAPSRVVSLAILITITLQLWGGSEIVQAADQRTGPTGGSALAFVRPDVPGLPPAPADLAVSKSASTNVIFFAEDIMFTYTLGVTNVGGAPSPVTYIHDSLPDGLFLQEVMEGNCFFNGMEVLGTVPGLQPGESTVFVFRVFAQIMDARTQISNTATVDPVSGETNLGNNSATLVIYVGAASIPTSTAPTATPSTTLIPSVTSTPSPTDTPTVTPSPTATTTPPLVPSDLAVSKSASVSNIPWAEETTFNYTLEVANIGGAPAPATWLHDSLPDGVIFQEGLAGFLYCGFNGMEMLYPVPALQPGENALFAFRVFAAIGDARTQISNTASVDPVPWEANLSNNSAATVIIVGALSFTNTPTSTSTVATTFTATATQTVVPRPTDAPTVTPSASATGAVTVTDTPTGGATATRTPVATGAMTPTPTNTPSGPKGCNAQGKPPGCLTRTPTALPVSTSTSTSLVPPTATGIRTATATTPPCTSVKHPKPKLCATVTPTLVASATSLDLDEDLIASPGGWFTWLGWVLSFWRA